MSSAITTIARAGQVAFIIRLIAGPQFHDIAPPGNWIGTLLLRRLLENALTARLSPPPKVGLALELHRAIGLVVADDRAAALDVVINELRAVGLLAATLVLWFDEQEQIWRRHPAGIEGPDLRDEQLAFAEFAKISEELLEPLVAKLRA